MTGVFYDDDWDDPADPPNGGGGTAGPLFTADNLKAAGVVGGVFAIATILTVSLIGGIMWGLAVGMCVFAVVGFITLLLSSQHLSMGDGTIDTVWLSRLLERFSNEFGLRALGRIAMIMLAVYAVWFLSENAGTYFVDKKGLDSQLGSMITWGLRLIAVLVAINAEFKRPRPATGG